MNLRAPAAIAAFFILVPPSVQAGVRDDVLRAMDQCATIADKDKRLACFDSLSVQIKQAIAEGPAAGPMTAEQQKSWFGFDFGNLFGSAPSQQTTPEKFGSENLPAPPPKPGEAPREEPIDSITMKVTDYALNPFGKFVVFLDGGQVWKQIGGEADVAKFNKNGNNTVQISRGVLGSYNMQINDSNKVFKVKRIK
ncbi:MAG TPA: hypothetical protein VMF58_13740 [Rhizomicrobium sp.]|nr:hypothetical protein [Rhizomicrobium sp.]